MASSKNPLHRLFKIDAAQHGDNTDYDFDPNANLEVISLGLSRTGTTSLQLALERLGFAPCHGGVDSYRDVKRRDAVGNLCKNVLDGRWKAGDPVLNKSLHSLFRGYRSITDTPAYHLRTELLAAYPKAKYLLTVRPGGAEEWYRSLWEASSFFWRDDFPGLFFYVATYSIHFLRRTNVTVRCYIDMWKKDFGGMGPHIYDAHNAEVRRVIPEDQLLVYDVREGWEPLCKYLDVPVPSEPFPRVNETGSMQTLYTGMMLYGLCGWLLYFGGAAGAAYVAYNPRAVKTGAESAISWARVMAAKWSKHKGLV